MASTDFVARRNTKSLVREYPTTLLIRLKVELIFLIAYAQNNKIKNLYSQSFLNFEINSEKSRINFKIHYHSKSKNCKFFQQRKNKRK